MFQPETERTNSSALIATAVVVLLVVAGGLWWFHHANHSFAEATITDLRTMPLHRQYAHQFGNAGADQTDDTLYLVLRVSVRNRAPNPIYLKSLHLHLSGTDGEQTATAFESSDLTRIFAGIPALKQMADAEGGKPLIPETEIAQGAGAEGYMVFQVPVSADAWAKRQGAALEMDFYHNAALTLPLPK